MELQKVQQELRELGFALIAASGDTEAGLQSAVSEAELAFTVLRDPDLAAAERFGIVFELDSETANRYAGAGISLPDGRLPVPAVFLIDRSGRIRFQYANPDYTVRLSGQELLEAARKVSSQNGADAAFREPGVEEPPDSRLSGSALTP